MKKLPEEVKDLLLNAMAENFTKLQERPNQYVVAIYNQYTDELLGYHYDTFCNKGMDMLNAKRYAGDNPYNQLKIIFENITNTFEKYPRPVDEIFSGVNNKVRESYGDLNLCDIYIDAVYLDEDTPKQSFRYSILDNDKLIENEK